MGCSTWRACVFAVQVVVEGHQFVQVACGGMHTVALDTEGCIWTWGVNDEGALGRKTGGTAWEDLSDEEKGDATLPGKAETPEGVKFTQVGGEETGLSCQNRFATYLGKAC
jgi:alpha-tubulin suppressor-like RCC1 family protein